MATRDCGTCSACCRWPSVPEINKPAGVPCHFLESCGYGCKQYSTRPASCSKYSCSWIEGYGAEGHQPNRCGLLIDRRDTQFGTVLIARELQPGASEDEESMRRMSADLGMVCLLVANDDAQRIRKIIAPRQIRRRFLRQFPNVRIYPDGTSKERISDRSNS